MMLEWAAFGGSVICSLLYGRQSVWGPSAGLVVSCLFIAFGLTNEIYAAAFSNLFFIAVHGRNLRLAIIENPERRKKRMLIADLCKEAHAMSKEKGWWEKDRNDGECIALMHSELSEALEGLRKPGRSDKIPEFSQVEEELADVMIRIGDYCEAHGLRLTEAIRAKMDYNAGREHKHGGKKF